MEYQKPTLENKAEIHPAQEHKSLSFLQMWWKENLLAMVCSEVAVLTTILRI